MSLYRSFVIHLFFFFSSGTSEQLNLSQEVLGLSQKATKGNIEISVDGIFRDLSSGRSFKLVAGSEFAPFGLCVPPHLSEIKMTIPTHLQRTNGLPEQLLCPDHVWSMTSVFITRFVVKGVCETGPL